MKELSKNKTIQRQLSNLEKKEKIFINKTQQTSYFSMIEKLEEKVPKGLKEKLEYAFYKGFQVVFQKGNLIIEKTYDKAQRQLDYDIFNYTFEKRKNKKSLNKLNKQINKNNCINLGISMIEGTGLGLLGIGIPDIPIFIGVLLKSIYEIALNYGYSYEREEEKYYILKLIEASLAQKEEKVKINKEIDQIASFFSNNIELNFDFDKQIKITASSLSTELLCIKFIQGLPIIGVIGGVSNFIYCKKITDYAKLKYQKRYLLSKLED